MNTASWIIVLILAVVIAAALWRMRRGGTGCGECKNCGSSSCCTTSAVRRSSKASEAAKTPASCGCAAPREQPVAFHQKRRS